MMEQILHYRIERKIGAGGMGEVYLATDTRLDRPVALKFLPESLRDNPEARERLLREARAASRLNHPNIVGVYAVEEHQGRDFIAMEYVQGQTLTEYMAGSDRALLPILDTAIQIAAGVKKAHEKEIIHRDLKPGNILLDADGRVRILDFGLARIGGAPHMTKTGSTVGTAAYMSPEQVQGESAEERSDIFSFGICLYELLAGTRPFTGEHEAAVSYAIVHEPHPSLTEHRDDLPRPLIELIDRCLQKDRSARPASMADVESTLTGVANQLRRDSAPSDSKSTLPSIAVLPFANMSADPEQEYFCDGIAEDIINNLCHVRGLRIAARTSSFSFKGQNQDIRNIGNSLNVDHILEGSVRRAGKRLRITAQLITVDDGYHMWSERYDRDMEDIFAVQDEIAENVAHALEVRLTDREREIIKKAPTDDITAYDYYLRARQWAHQGVSRIEVAIELFRKAIAKDPGFAAAYAGLANVHSHEYMYLGRIDSGMADALSNARKALELDPNLAEAHAAYGYALSLGDDFGPAQAEFDKAIELNPSLFEAYYLYARACFAHGMHKKAAELYERAADVYPEDFQALLLAASIYHSLGADARAYELLQRGYAIVERILKLDPANVRARSLGCHALAALGRIDEAVEMGQEMVRMAPDNTGALYNYACLLAVLKRDDEALDHLERTVAAGFTAKRWIENDHDWERLRAHPRFVEILNRLDKPGAQT